MTTAPLVCIVDDTVDYCFLVEVIFKRDFPSCSLHVSVNGQAFLDALPQLDRKPNLVLLDQHMPQLSGYQTLVALRQQTQYRSIPVVMMSADASHVEIKSFYEAGATSFLKKHMEFHALRESLRTACQYGNIAQ